MKKYRSMVIVSVFMLLILCLPTTVEAASKVKISKSKVTVYVGNSTTLKLLNSKGKVTWSSSKKGTVSVNSKGKVTGKRSGSAKITAKNKGKKYTCRVTVKNPKLNKTNVSLTPSSKVTLKVTGSKVVKWSSSNTKVATVSSKGVVTAKGTGNAIIYCKVSSNMVLSCNILVQKVIINTPIPDAHVHKYVLNKKVNATCTEDGYELYKCFCGKTHKVILIKKGHDYEITSNKPATCKENGLKVEECVNCGSKIKTILESTTHSYSLVNTVEPTCNSDGYQEFLCSVCGDKHTEVIPKLNHEYSKTVKQPTESIGGYVSHTCIYCGDRYVDEYKKPTQLNDWDYKLYHMGGVGYISLENYKGTNKNLYVYGTYKFFDALDGAKEYRTVCSAKFNSGTVETLTFANCKVNVADFKNNSTIKKVTFSNCTINTLENAFVGCPYLMQVEASSSKLENPSLKGTFKGCSRLSYLTLPSLSTEGYNPISLDYTFYGCGSLNVINLSNLKGLPVITANYTFAGCSGNNKFYLDSLDFSDIYSCEAMFKGCSNIGYIQTDNSLYSKVNKAYKDGVENDSLNIENMFTGSNWTIEDFLSNTVVMD